MGEVMMPESLGEKPIEVLRFIDRGEADARTACVELFMRI